MPPSTSVSEPRRRNRLLVAALLLIGAAVGFGLLRGERKPAAPAEPDAALPVQREPSPPQAGSAVGQGTPAAASVRAIRARLPPHDSLASREFAVPLTSRSTVADSLRVKLRERAASEAYLQGHEADAAPSDFARKP